MADSNLSESEELELLELENKNALAMQQQQTPQMGVMDQAKLMGKMASVVLPDIMKKGTALAAVPLAGAVGGVPAAALTAGTMAIGKRMADLKKQSDAGQVMDTGTPLQEAKGPMIQTALAGLMQQPGLLKNLTPADTPAIGATETPGVQPAIDMVKKGGSAIKNGLMRWGASWTGAQQSALEQAGEQGLKKTYWDTPNMESAQATFGNALGPEGRAAMAEDASAANAFDPQLAHARNTAKDVGIMIEKGQPVSATQALQGRQAVDRVISSTPVTDKKTLDILYGWRNRFDNELASQSGKLADASRLYRRAVVKDQLTNVSRINKSGRPSALLPMLLGSGGRGGMGILNAVTMTSPLAWGLASAGGGDVARGLNVLGQDPTLRQTLLQVLQKISASKQKK